jgi:hypothetical protein
MLTSCIRSSVRAAAAHWNAVRITHRADLDMQTSKLLKRLGLEAEEFAVPAEVSEKMVKSLNEWDIAGPAERSAHALAGAHVALWKRCAAGDKPLLILEDGLLLPHRLPQITAHLTACVEHVLGARSHGVHPVNGCADTCDHHARC